SSRITPSVVMPALVAGIHVLLFGRQERKTRMAGTSPAMTAEMWSDMNEACSAAVHEIGCQAGRDVVGDHPGRAALGIVHPAEAGEALRAQRIGGNIGRGPSGHDHLFGRNLRQSVGRAEGV